MNKQVRILMAIAITFSFIAPASLQALPKSLPWKKLVWRVGVPVGLGILAGISAYQKVQQAALTEYIKDSETMRHLVIPDAQLESRRTSAALRDAFTSGGVVTTLALLFTSWLR